MLTDLALRSLEQLVGRDGLLADPAELVAYETDASFERGAPDAVVLPVTADQVVALVRWAKDNAIPLVARGAGTGLSGGAVSERGGVVVAFSRMNRVLELDALGRRAVVEPGVLNLALDGAARRHGLYYPPDPSSQRASTIGGNVAENAGGPHCFKYGVTTNYVMGLDMVLADGAHVRTGGAAFDYPELDWAGLVTGSEGTLAAVTSIALRLVRNPPGIKTLMAIFDSVEACGAAVSAVIAAGLVPATMEMMDRKFARAVEEYAHAGLPTDAGAVLIAEVDGFPAGLDPQIQELAAILARCGGRELKIARTAQEREQIWYARKSAAGVFSKLAPSYYLVDITVPRSRLAETLRAANEICERLDLQVQYVLHAGDGNLHPVLMIPKPDDPALVESVHQAAKEMVELGVRLNGSLSGEHGVGIEKRAYMPLMFNAAELSVMWDLKQIFDPRDLFNPGKIFSRPFPKEPLDTPPVKPISAPIAPTSSEQAAEALAGLAAAGKQARIGAGYGDAVQISTAGLAGIRGYAPQDLYVTAGAGTRLSDLQAFLARDRMQVPLAAPWTAATIGGIIAANVNAPLRMRYGSVRDIVLAMTVVLGDGRVIRAGRPVVKNVAGYDLPKVFVGSYGSLGLVTEATLKLVPLARASQTLLLRPQDMATAISYGNALLPVALVASAIVLSRSTNGWALAYTAEGHPQDVAAELEEARLRLRAAGAPSPDQVDAPSGTERWVRAVAGAGQGALLLRVGVSPRDVGAYLEANAARLGDFFADLAAGLVYAARQAGDLESARAWLDELRASAAAVGGYAVIMSAPEEFRSLDAWGYRPETLDLMSKLRARWDPANVLVSEMFRAP